ncbi:unnamed protein product [Rotaria magnacalcarata]|uniref:Uncharacterized protein n=1 Tax=Rotaria magnacalcarata TaxID=392030 RepID=A0A815ZRI1_9BILA|nr:unnamed protein product [Rotaria magnacalcarata]CAF1596057.1 unnamed protein product [Rotaria magnacalcarata]
MWLLKRLGLPMTIAVLSAIVFAMHFGIIGYSFCPSPTIMKGNSFGQGLINFQNDGLEKLNSALSQSSILNSFMTEYSLSFQRKSNCNLRTPKACFRTNKSLVVTFWRQESKERWFASNMLLVFLESYFEHIVMVHDNSSWNSHPAFDKIIWIHVAGQLRFWYIKRFLSPHIFRAYRYIWFADDDVEFNFDTRRWTDFVEIGPMFIANNLAAICIWNFLSEKVGLGYGIDMTWCRFLSSRCFKQIPVSKTCAILDAFLVHHNSKSIGTLRVGLAEIPAYRNYYQKYSSKKVVFGAVGSDSSDLASCQGRQFN